MPSLFQNPGYAIGEHIYIDRWVMDITVSECSVKADGRVWSVDCMLFDVIH